MKALIIGLDGATWEVFDDYLLENHMPNLNRLKKKGSSGVLRSTHPPLTSAAWTSCITGCQPYKHGIVGFLNFSFDDNNLPVSSAANCLVPTIWEELSHQGYKVASINVPWTYPCRKVNGVMVAGYGVPGMDVEFTYPPEFAKELLAKIPDYEVVADWKIPKGKYDAELLEKNICSVELRFRQRIEAAQLAYERFSPDVMMVQFQNTDQIEHRVFSYLGSRTRDRYPLQRDRIFKTFEILDDSIGHLLKIAGDNCNVIVVSDHGQCRTEGLIRPNIAMRNWGYLKNKNWLGRMIHRFRRKMEKKGILKNESTMLEMRSMVNWKKTRAMVVFSTMTGYVFLNVKGRNKNGLINPGDEYDKTIKDLREKFSNMRDSAGPFFEHVKTPAELYGIESAAPEIFGDLVLVPRSGYPVQISVSRKGGPVKILSDNSIVGTHSYEGIYIFSGPDFRTFKGPQTHITDIAPTLLGMLGAEIPSHMDGKVIENAFSHDIKVKYKKSSDITAFKIENIKKLTKKEDSEITRRLSALGYMD